MEKKNATTYVADSSATGSLKELAKEITGDERDWVCIWAVGSADKWSRYPQPNCGATADISNLVSKSTKRLVMRQGYKLPDHYMSALDRVFGAGEKVWTSGGDAGRHIANITGEGRSPLDSLVLGAHNYGGGSSVSLANNSGGPKFTAADVIQAASERDNTQNSLTSSSQKKGPPRCWFTRTGRAYGVACNSHPGWTTDWADKIMRSGTKAYGAEPVIYGKWSGNNAAYLHFPESTRKNYNIKSLVKDPNWKSKNGTQ